MKLLQRMGWRQGKGIGPSRDGPEPASKKSRWGRVAGVGAANTPVFLPPAKSDVHGLGFDPFKVSLIALQRAYFAQSCYFQLVT